MPEKITFRSFSDKNAFIGHIFFISNQLGKIHFLKNVFSRVFERIWEGSDKHPFDKLGPIREFRERKYVRSRLNALTKDAAQITDSRGDQPGDCGEDVPTAIPPPDAQALLLA